MATKVDSTVCARRECATHVQNINCMQRTWRCFFTTASCSQQMMKHAHICSKHMSFRRQVEVSRQNVELSAAGGINNMLIWRGAKWEMAEMPGWRQTRIMPPTYERERGKGRWSVMRKYSQGRGERTGKDKTFMTLSVWDIRRSTLHSNMGFVPRRIPTSI